MEESAYKETQVTWNKVASLYQEKFMNLDLYDRTYNELLRLLDKSARIIEIGCGPGNIARYLLRKNPELEMLLTDVSPEMIKLAQANNPGARCRTMDARELGKVKDKFDACIAGFCLPYLSLEDARKFFGNVHHIITSNGIFYFSALEGNLAQSGFESGNNGRIYVNYYSSEMLEELLRASGFRIIYQENIFFGRKENTETHLVFIAGKNNPT